MFKYFSPDRRIALADLANMKFEKYDIVLEIQPDIDGCPTAQLTCGDSSILVRTNKEGNANRFFPVEIDISAVETILDVIGRQFGAVFKTEYDNTCAYRYVQHEIEVD